MKKQSDFPLDRPNADLEANEGGSSRTEKRRLSIIGLERTDDYEPKYQFNNFPYRVLGRSAFSVVLYVSFEVRGPRCCLNTDSARSLFTGHCYP